MKGIEQPVARPLLRYYGGKWRIASAIIALMPEHSVYTEIFGGGASVLLQKARAKTEVYNDLDSAVVNVFRQMRDRGPELIRLLELTPFSREEYERAYKGTRDALESARRFIFRAAAGIGSDSMHRKNGFRIGLLDEKLSTAGSWAGMVPVYPSIVARLRGLIIENRPALQVLRSFDAPHTLHYVDPPYLFSTRKERGRGYAHELLDHEHEQLAEALHGAEGMVMLSGYESPLYDRLYKDWRKVTFAARDNANGHRVEALWMSPTVPVKGPSHEHVDLFDGSEVAA